MARVRDWFGSIRVRTVLVVVIVVGLAFAVAGFALVTGLSESLVNDRREVAEARADEVVAAIEEAGDPTTATIEDVDDQWFQVFDRAGVVLAASANAAGWPVVVTLVPDEAARVSADIGDDSQYVVAAAAASIDAGQVTIIVGRGLDDVADSTDILVQLLVLTLPALLVLVAAIAYLVVGRALLPVESMRREVESITHADLHRRVAVPAHTDEVSRLGSTMNAMLDRLQSASDKQRQFVSDAAHELRSPVASLRQHSEVAAAHPDTTSAEELATVVSSESGRLERLVEDLVVLAHADEDRRSGRLAPGQMTEVDLDDIVFQEAARTRAARVTVDTSRVSGGRVRGDSAHLRRMVANLLDNASRHARERVTVTLRQAPDGSVVLSVEDDGDGIAADDRERVFERFVRLDDARARDTGGSGLGLAIVAEVAKAHGGSARATESRSGGAALEVSLPGVG